MLGRILTAALVAGLVAGLVATGLQMARLWPLIQAAESFEAPAAAGAHGHGAAAQPQAAPADAAHDGFERPLFTTIFNLLAGFGFALLLNGAIALRRAAGGPSLDWRQGLLWGLGGFAAFGLAPALGLPPELPGMASAELLPRQLWWVGTAAATAAGLALMLWARAWPWRTAGAVLLLLPHVIGAPRPATIEGGALPAPLAAEFAIASLAVAAIFWMVLGAVSGLLQRRLP